MRTIFYGLAIISMFIISAAFAGLVLSVAWDVVISILKWFWTAPILLMLAFVLWISQINRKKN